MSQPLPVREQLKALEHLQELDLKIDSLKKQKASFPNALRALDDAWNRLQSQTKAKQNEIDDIEKAKRQTQAAIDLNNDRVTRANSKLESVQNGQEFQAANKEIEQLKKLNLSLEEQLKKSDTDIKTASESLEKLKEDSEKAAGERTTQSSALSTQGTDLDGQIAELMATRKPQAEKVDKRILAQYDRVRMARAGLGLVPAVGGRCKGCNMVVPPQLYNEIHRANSIHDCPSCHRILFVPMSGQSGEAPAPQQG